MVEPVLKALVVATAGIAAGVVLNAKSVEAAMLTYDFTVDVKSGQYVGKYTGNFSFESSAPRVDCFGSVQRCVTPTTHNLTVAFNFLGKTYTEKDDLQYNSFPVGFFAGKNGLGQDIFVLSLLVLPPQATTIGFLINGTDFYVGNNNPFQETKLDAKVTYAPRPVPTPGPGGGCKPGECSSAVPEPSEIMGSALALGLLGFGLRLRRKAGVIKDESIKR